MLKLRGSSISAPVGWRARLAPLRSRLSKPVVLSTLTSVLKAMAPALRADQRPSSGACRLRRVPWNAGLGGRGRVQLHARKTKHCLGSQFFFLLNGR